MFLQNECSNVIHASRKPPVKTLLLHYEWAGFPYFDLHVSCSTVFPWFPSSEREMEEDVPP